MNIVKTFDKNIDTERTYVPVSASTNPAAQTQGNMSVNDIVESAFEAGLKDTFWDDARVPVNSTKLGGSKDPTFSKVLDDGAGSQGVFAYLFDDTQDKELYFAVQLSHAWKIGTNLLCHVHWFSMDDGAAGAKVSWGLEYSLSQLYEVFPNTSIIYGNVSSLDETPIAKKHYLTSIGEIDMSGIDKVSPMIIGRVFRDASGTGLVDDLVGDAALIEIDFHFQIDSIGSKELYTK